jgi:hypothetical protein
MTRLDKNHKIRIKYFFLRALDSLYFTFELNARNLVFDILHQNLSKVPPII